VGFCDEKKQATKSVRHQDPPPSASTQDITNVARNQGDFSRALGDAFSQNLNIFSLQERRQAVDNFLLSPRGVSDPRPAATGGRGEPLPPLRGAREVGPVEHQRVRSHSPLQDSRRNETGQVRKKVSVKVRTKLPGLKCLEQPRAILNKMSLLRAESHPQEDETSLSQEPSYKEECYYEPRPKNPAGEASKGGESRDHAYWRYYSVQSAL
jgi:hypothetical protein